MMKIKYFIYNKYVYFSVEFPENIFLGHRDVVHITHHLLNI